MPSKGNRALVWKYFRKEGEKCVVCGVCGQRLAYRSSTSTMRYHLERKHPIHWGNDQETTSDEQIIGSSALDNVNCGESSALTPVIDKIPMFSNSSTKASAITFYITQLIIKDLLPLSEIHNSGMKQLLKYLEPSYTVPDRDTITTSLIRLYDDVKPSVQQILDDVKHMALTVDIWTSSNTQFYATITANWVTDAWNLKNCVLATQPLPVGYSWDDVELIINENLTIYNIPVKHVSAVVVPADFAVSGTAAYPVVRCFASTLNNAVLKGFEYAPIARVILAARKLVSNVKHLSGSIVELALQQAEIKVSEIQIDQDISTLWFSTFDMLQQLRDQRSIICAVVGDTQMSKASDGLLAQSNSEEWELLNRIVDILKPLKTSTEVMSSVKNVSLSSAYPILYGLTTVHLADTTEESHSAWTFRQIIRKEICKIWNLHSEQNSVPLTAMFSSILDPRYHNLAYLTGEQQTTSVQSLNVELVSAEIDAVVDIKQHNSVASTSDREMETLSPLDFLLGRHVLLEKGNLSMSTKESRESELKSYLDTVLNPSASTECDPLFWWQCNSQRFPHLQVLARKYLGITSLCAPAERLFSDAGLTFLNARAQLEQEYLDYVIFLHNNMATVLNK